MAHFRGEVKGQRGEASRLGSKASGMVVVAQAWGGQVVTRLWHEHGHDMVRVYVEGNPAVYADSGKDRTLYYGPLSNARSGEVYTGNEA